MHYVFFAGQWGIFKSCPRSLVDGGTSERIKGTHMRSEVPHLYHLILLQYSPRTIQSTIILPRMEIIRMTEKAMVQMWSDVIRSFYDQGLNLVA